MNESFAFHGYSMNNQMFCMVQGDDIYQIDYSTGSQKIIGKTTSAYNELEQTTTEYYNKLVELGVIVPPKDPNQTMAEMQETMNSMASLIKSLSEEVKELKRNGHEQNYEHGGEDVPECKPRRSGTKSKPVDAGNAG